MNNDLVKFSHSRFTDSRNIILSCMHNSDYGKFALINDLLFGISKSQSIAPFYFF